MQNFVRSLVISLGLLPASAGTAAIVVDGTRDAEYGAPLAVQTVDTGFGDNFSEIDAAYAKIAGGRLYMLFTGNQEQNQNKLDVYIDSVAGGENALSATPGYAFQGGSSSALAGLTFDTGFAADYHLASAGVSSSFGAMLVNREGGTSSTVPYSTDVAAFDFFMASGLIAAGQIGPGASGTALTQNLYFAINNTNPGGVGGIAGATANNAAAAGVTTGMEFSIALADLGNPAPGATIRIAPMINGGGWNYLSNQFLGGLPIGTTNLGGDGTGGFIGSLGGVNLNNFSGNQYISIVTPIPEPAAWVPLAAAGSLVLALWRRRNAAQS